MKVTPIIMTYNEKENIGPMIEAWLKIAKENPKYQFEILNVDGNSPDGTGRITEEYSRKFKNVHLLSGPRRGMGKELIDGYQYAIKRMGADVVIPIDVDFQFDPFLAPKLLEKIDEGYDVVIASRHVVGGEANFDWFRKITHFVSDTLLAYWWAGIKEVKDHAGLFKAIRVKGVLDKVNLNKFDVIGFSVNMKTIYELSKVTSKFYEVPAIFGQRRAGQPTTVGLKSMKWFVKYVLETVSQTTKIRFERSPKLFKFLRFGIVGGIGFVINFVGFRVLKIVFKNLPLDISLINTFANAIAAEAAIISNFTWNNLWTFAQEKITSFGKLFSKFVQFNLSSLVNGIMIPSAVIGLLTKLFGDKYSSLYLVVAIFGLTVPLNWVIYNKVIWKKK